jgi:hypothetical protein
MFFVFFINVWYDSWVPFYHIAWFRHGDIERYVQVRGPESHVDVLKWHVRVGMLVE